MIIHKIGVPLPVWVNFYEVLLRRSAARTSLWLALLVRERTYGVRN